MKKKILTAILSGLLIATLAGCGNQLPENDAPNSMASADTTLVTGANISSAPETASEPETSGTASPETKPQAEKEKKTKTRSAYFYVNHRKRVMLIGYSKEREEEFRQYWDKEIRDQRKWTRGMNLF